VAKRTWLSTGTECGLFCGPQIVAEQSSAGEGCHKMYRCPQTTTAMAKRTWPSTGTECGGLSGRPMVPQSQNNWEECRTTFRSSDGKDSDDHRLKEKKSPLAKYRSADFPVWRRPRQPTRRR